MESRLSAQMLGDGVAAAGGGRTIRREAACRGRPDPFFDPAREVEAKSVCAGCDVKWDCLGYALASNQNYGVWGGMTPEERRSVRRRIDRWTVQPDTRGRDVHTPPTQRCGEIP